jgi:4-amino-4-deoxy-L-arabinose transferase-like glycosyltransferase
MAPAAPTRLFNAWLAGIALVALALRLVYATQLAPDLTPAGDTLLYSFMGNSLAHGHGFASYAGALRGQLHPTSAYPPLYPLYLAGWSLLGLSSLAYQRAVSCLLGAVTVVLIGMLGRRVAGERAGLVAAALAAIYPQLLMVDGAVTTESAYAPLVAALALLAYRYVERAGAGRAALLGGAIGLATLARSEAIALLVLLALPLAWRAGEGRRARVATAMLAAAALVLAPWFVRNWIVQDEPILLTSNSGLTALASNCDATYYGGHVGFVEHRCAFDSPCDPIRDETRQATCMQRRARTYVGEHLGRVPIVVAARVARLWNLYGQRTDIGYGEQWSRNASVAKAGMAMYALLMLLAIPGAFALHRRRVPLLPLLAPFALVTLTAVTAFGFSRYRLAAEIPLTVLAATGIIWLAQQRRRPGLA